MASTDKPTVRVSLSHEQHRLIKSHAATEGMGISTYMRQATLRAINADKLPTHKTLKGRK